MYNNNNTLNEEQIAAFLKDAVSRVDNATQADIDAFKVIKKLYSQNVPFSRRKYVAALLVKQAASAISPRSRYGHDKDKSHDRDRNSERSERSSKFERNSSRSSERAEKSERPEKAPRVQIDPSAASTIFISIGRNRRVFPRDLIGILISVAGLQRDRIGEIRVLANYSFVQLFTEDCEKVISALNGYDYRGRKISVSYSQKKPDSADDSSSEKDAPRAHSIAADSMSEPQNQQPLDEDKIPANVSNESHGVIEHSESSKISEEQSAFAAQQSKISTGDSSSSQTPYSETTDDGQVKSHFGTGAAY